MKIPKSINVLGVPYTVHFEKGLSEAHGLDGYADPSQYRIVLEEGLKSNARCLKRVFLHEVAHCFAFESGLHDVLERQAIEFFCQNLSGLLVTMKL